MYSQRIAPPSGVVFDFDGTMGFLFKDFDLSQTVRLMSEKMKRCGVAFDAGLDAFDVFQEIAAQIPNDDSRRANAYMDADKVLTDAEMVAVETCSLVPGVAEVMQLIHDKGVRVGIATNNSAQCVHKFLRRINLEFEIPVIGRIGEHPELMKPNPWSVIETANELQAPVKDLIFVGDTKRDYLTAEQVGCKFIGLAATAKKRDRLIEVVPEDRMVSDFYELREYLFS